MIDDPVRGSLLGTHAHLARRSGDAAAYALDVAPFSAQPRDDAEAEDLARLLGPGGLTVHRTLETWVPPGWSLDWELPGVQMVLDDAVATPADPGAVVLGPPDVPEMLDLVARTQPGPFAWRTVEMGRYLGIRENGTLIAMAGERMRPPGGSEISAVCTDAAHRGRGLASRLVLAVAAVVRARGETPFLHASAANTNAVRLYEQLGFVLRATPSFVSMRAPEDGRVPEERRAPGDERPDRESRAVPTALGET